jgi:hypothetical protein
VESRARSVSRLLPFGAAVVWDAFTDPVLVQGWLAPIVTPLIGAGAGLEVSEVPLPAASGGVLRSLEPGSAALLDLGSAGSVRFEATVREPLPSGRSQCMLVAVATPAHELAAVGILEALDARVTALHELLRGRPVVWSARSADDDSGPRA